MLFARHRAILNTLAVLLPAASGPYSEGWLMHATSHCLPPWNTYGNDLNDVSAQRVCLLWYCKLFGMAPSPGPISNSATGRSRRCAWWVCFNKQRLRRNEMVAAHAYIQYTQASVSGPNFSSTHENFFEIEKVANLPWPECFARNEREDEWEERNILPPRDRGRESNHRLDCLAI